MLSKAIQQVLFTRPLEKEVPDIVRKYGGSLYVPAPTSTPIRNLFSYTQDFSNVVWFTTNCTKTTAQTDPLGATNAVMVTDNAGINAFIFQQITDSAPLGKTYTFSCWLKRGTKTGNISVQIKDAALAVTAVQTGFNVTSEWAKYSVTGTFTGSPSANVRAVVDPANNVDAGTYYIAFPQLELGSTATAYQAIAAAGTPINVDLPGTCFQDSAGTTPCTVDSPVGYLKDLVGTNHATQGTAGFKPILRGKVKNLLLNSATLSTQNITSVAAPYTLHFTGTGTVTLSGTSTAGPLVGTGASDRVSLTFTPTAGTLTLTVSGSVTTAQLELGSKVNPYIPTTTAAASSSYGPYWLDFDGTDDRLQLGSVPFQMSGNQTVIVSGQPLAAAKPMFALAAGSTSESLPYLGTNASSYLGYEASGGGATITAFDTVSSLGINSVLSAVKTTDAIYVYKNSKAIATGTTSGTYTTATNAMLGGSGRSTVVSYRGSINLAAVLAQAATQTDMRKIEKYAAKLSGAQL